MSDAEKWADVHINMPLEQSKKEIRLLEFYPESEAHRSGLSNHQEPGMKDEAKEPLRLRMLKASLLEHPEYRALSYVWGPSKLGRSVTLTVKRKCSTPSSPSQTDKHEDDEVTSQIEVTDNLLSAIKDYDPEGLERQLLPLWIDALCINQRDPKEKSWQVAMMGDVYRSAFSVRAWLGETPEPLYFRTDQLLDTLYLVAVKGQELFPGRIIPPLNVHRGIPFRSDDPFSYIDRDMVEWLSTSVKLVDSPFSGFDSENSTYNISSKALRALLGSPYWKRVWIWQEVLLAPRILFWWGPVCITSNELHTAIEIIAKATQVSGATDGGKVEDGTVFHSKAHIGHANNPLSALDWKYNKERYGRRRKAWEILEWNARTGGLKATVPVDYVFAFLGVISDDDSFDVDVDYSTSSETTYTKAAMSCMKTQGMYVLALCQGPKKLTSLPSWVPDWTAWSPGPTLFNITEAYQHLIRSRRAKSGHIWDESPYAGYNFEESSEGPVLVVGGNMITSFKCQLPRMRNSDPKSRLIRQIWDFQAKLYSAIPTVEQFATAYPTEEDRHAAFASVLVAGGEDLDGNETFYPTVATCSRLTSSYQRLLNPAFTGHPRSSFIKNCIRTCTDIIDVFTDADPTTLAGRSIDGILLEEFVKSPGLYYKISFEDAVDLTLTHTRLNLKKELDLFFHRLHFVGQGRRPFLCVDGYLGLGPEGMEDGDVISYLDGANVPYILRPLRSGYFKLVGEAYVYGLMDRVVQKYGIQTLSSDSVGVHRSLRGLSTIVQKGKGKSSGFFKFVRWSLLLAFL